tara:strand:+ start:284 stop:664 length:381 start_codon:yes stop_codon:yes gene_type:complete
MKNLTNGTAYVKEWLTQKYGYWRKSYDKGHTITDLALSRMEGAENIIGAVALWSLMLLIKIQHIKGGGKTYDSIMTMDGNADNWHELSDYKPPSTGKSEHSGYFPADAEYDKLLVKTASSLLRYGS